MLPDTWQREVFEYLTKSRFEPLIAAGVRVFEYVAPASPLVVCRGGAVRPYVHAKLLSVDGAVASVGSANFDATASFWEREVGVVLEDATVVADLEAQLDAAIATSHRIVLDSADWRRDALQRAVVARLWPDALYS
jgi:cardiolipin synthase